MMMRRTVARLAGALLGVLILASCLVPVDVSEYGVLTSFGRVVRVIAEPGLHLKLPYPFQTVLKLDKRLLTFTPPNAEYLSQDKKNLIIHSLVVWRIADPVRFVSTVGTRVTAEGQLADLVLAKIGAVVGAHPSAALISLDGQHADFARVVGQILTEADATAREAYGITLVDVRLRQLNLPDQNRASVFARMQAERAKIAMKYRSEGERESKKIIAEADRERTRILAEAYREATRTKSEGDAQAMRLYAQALSKDPQFYRFWRTLQVYGKILDSNTTLFLPADAEIFRLLNHPAPAPTGGK